MSCVPALLVPQINKDLPTVRENKLPFTEGHPNPVAYTAGTSHTF